MADYTLNDAWCSVQDVRNQNALLTASVIDGDTMNGSVDDAVELIKGKLRARYDLTKFTIPLPADLMQIRLLTAKLACYKAAGTRPDVVSNPEMATFLWTLAMKELNELSEGNASLPSGYLVSGNSTMPGAIRGALTPRPTRGRTSRHHDDLRD